ncbi:MAG: RagB/SusD family nutrient uptake outer membrane protein [bacterium]
MRPLKTFSILVVCLLLLLACWGCGPDMNIENQNAPDTERALGNPNDVEALIGGAYLTWWGVNMKSYPGMALSTAADELTSSWGNFHMRWASTEPRIEYDNSPTYTYNNFTETPWYDLYSVISTANDGLKLINDGMVIGDATRTLRAKAFAKFCQGLAHGFLALFFNKAFIFDETVDLESDQLEFSPYNEVMDAAIAQLEEAASLFSSGSFDIPSEWINGLTLSSDYMAQLTHSYIARYLSCVARTSADRAAVDWNRVLDHINKGITEDFAPEGDGDWWWARHFYQGQHPTWVRADYKTVGLADTSGNYQAWLATPVADRMPFLIHTADKRITDGNPEGTGLDFRYEGTPRHRPDRGTYHFSFYFNYRFEYHYLNDATGPMPAFTTRELDLLKAEALFRLGQSGVADLINKTRVARGGLPPVSDSDPDLWDQLVYEKKIECYLAGGAGLAFFDGRAWDKLVSGTPYHWPVPGLELEILLEPYYTFGGPGGKDTVPKVIRNRESLQVTPF